MNYFLALPPRRTGNKAHRGCAKLVKWALILPLLVGLSMASVGHAGQPRDVAATTGDQPGGTVEGVLVIARRLSPQLMARALEIDAARSRVSVAGSLPDPTLRVTSDEIDRVSGPRQNKMIYSVEQDIPLWGKRELRRQAAEAEVNQKSAELKDAEAELTERVKVTFALYYQTSQALRATRELRPILANVAQVARDRYARSLVPQQDVIRSELEATRLENEITRMEGSFRSAQGRLNALLLRPLDATLVLPRVLRPLPPPDRLAVVQLVDRARAGNPSLAANDAMVRAGERNADLARRGWYPDVTLSLGAIDRTGNGPNGYVASIGVKVPLQWGLHEGQVRDAVAQMSAARARQDVARQQIQGDLAEAVAALEASRRVATLSVRRLIPLAQTMLRSATADYAVGKIELASVLQAERDVTAVRIELLSTELDQQRQLAAIERLIGGDL